MGKTSLWLLRLFLIVISIILIYQLLRKILGGSWDLETIILTLVVTNLSYSFYLGNKLSILQGSFMQFEKKFEDNKK